MATRRRNAATIGSVKQSLSRGDCGIDDVAGYNATHVLTRPVSPGFPDALNQGRKHQHTFVGIIPATASQQPSQQSIQVRSGTNEAAMARAFAIMKTWHRRDRPRAGTTYPGMGAFTPASHSFRDRLPDLELYGAAFRLGPVYQVPRRAFRGGGRLDNETTAMVCQEAEFRAADKPCPPGVVSAGAEYAPIPAPGTYTGSPKGHQMLASAKSEDLYDPHRWTSWTTPVTHQSSGFETVLTQGRRAEAVRRRRRSQVGQQYSDMLCRESEAGGFAHSRPERSTTSSDCHPSHSECCHSGIVLTLQAPTVQKRTTGRSMSVGFREKDSFLGSTYPVAQAVRHTKQRKGSQESSASGQLARSISGRPSGPVWPSSPERAVPSRVGVPVTTMKETEILARLARQQHAVQARSSRILARATWDAPPGRPNTSAVTPRLGLGVVSCHSPMVPLRHLHCLAGSATGRSLYWPGPWHPPARWCESGRLLDDPRLRTAERRFKVHGRPGHHTCPTQTLHNPARHFDVSAVSSAQGLHALADPPAVHRAVAAVKRIRSARRSAAATTRKRLELGI